MSVWEHMPEAKSDEDAAFEAKWAKIIAVRDDVKKVLEQARADKTIGSSLEAAVTLYCSDEIYDFLNAIPMDELADLMIVFHVDLVKGEGGVKGLVEGLGVSLAHAAGNKCLRCWKFDTLPCPRCANSWLFQWAMPRCARLKPVKQELCGLPSYSGAFGW